MDRNLVGGINRAIDIMSLSARRAWIEIRKGGILRSWACSSLSARRAWIEIVDYIIDYVNDASRSPQGERG